MRIIIREHGGLVAEIDGWDGPVPRAGDYMRHFHGLCQQHIQAGT